MGTFSKSLGSFKVKSIAEADRVRRAIIIELFNSVILDTPVDTGRARANWQVSTGAQKTDVIDSTNGQRAIDEVETVVNASPEDETIFLTNNVPYISFLEYGSSKQAPAGMVRKNMARIWGIIRANSR